MILWGHLICVHMTHRESCWGIITDVFLSTVQSINFPVYLIQASYDQFYKVNQKRRDSRFICFCETAKTKSKTPGYSSQQKTSGVQWTTSVSPYGSQWSTKDTVLNRLKRSCLFQMSIYHALLIHVPMYTYIIKCRVARGMCCRDF